MLTGNTKHGALSLASIALLTSLVMPKPGLASDNSDVLAPPEGPAAATQVENQAELFGSARLPNLDQMEFHTEAQAKLAEVATRSINATAREKSESTDSSSIAAWALAGAMAVWKFGEQMFNQARTLISKNLVDKGKNALLSRIKSGNIDVITAGAPISLIKIEAIIEEGVSKFVEKPIPFKPDTIGELFTDPKTLAKFEQAFERCTEAANLPTLNLERGEKPHTYKGLSGINEVIWETVSRYFTNNPKEFLKPNGTEPKEEYLLIPTCSMAEDRSDNNTLAILLIKKSDLKNSDNLPPTLKKARKAYAVREKAMPDKPLFLTLAA